MKKSLVTTLLAASVLNGCMTFSSGLSSSGSSSPARSAPVLSSSGLSSENASAIPQSVTQKQLAQSTQNPTWWQAFHDPFINRFVDELLQQNLDLKIALVRVEQARALHKAAAASLFPSVSVNAGWSRSNAESGLISPQTVARAGFDAAWEIDLFGANRAAISATDARFLASKASAMDMQRIMTADLIHAIFAWKQAQQILAETEKLLQVQTDQAALLRSKVDVGLIDATSLERSLAQREQTQAKILLLKSTSKNAQYQIERLLGKKPEALAQTFAESAAGLSTEISAETKLFIDPITSLNLLEIPLETIRHRPDIRVAALDLIAMQANLKNAEANLWPKISLSTFFGVQETSDGLKTVTASNPVWSVASTLAVPFINFGRLRGMVEAANAQAQSAAFGYENAVLLALQETHTALSDYLNSIKALKQQAAVHQYQQERVALIFERYHHGLTDMIELSYAQTELNQTSIALIESKTAAAVAYIKLQKALAAG